MAARSVSRRLLDKHSGQDFINPIHKVVQVSSRETSKDAEERKEREREREYVCLVLYNLPCGCYFVLHGNASSLSSTPTRIRAPSFLEEMIPASRSEHVALSSLTNSPSSWISMIWQMVLLTCSITCDPSVVYRWMNSRCEAFVWGIKNNASSIIFLSCSNKSLRRDRSVRQDEKSQFYLETYIYKMCMQMIINSIRKNV